MQRAVFITRSSSLILSHGKRATLDSIIKVTAEKFEEWGSMTGLLALPSNVVVI
jgi:hypothetical protein